MKKKMSAFETSYTKKEETKPAKKINLLLSNNMKKLSHKSQNFVRNNETMLWQKVNKTFELRICAVEYLEEYVYSFLYHVFGGKKGFINVHVNSDGVIGEVKVNGEHPANFKQIWPKMLKAIEEINKLESNTIVPNEMITKISKI